MRRKFRYLINGKEVSRNEFKNNLAVLCSDTVDIGNGLGMGIANYDKAESLIKKMQDKNTSSYTLVANNDSYKIEVIK